MPNVKQKWEKPQTRSVRSLQRDHLAQPTRSRATMGHEILRDSLSEILLTALQKRIHEPGLSRPSFQHRALQHLCGRHGAICFNHHFCTLSPCFLIELVQLHETNPWDFPVSEHSEPGSAGHQQLTPAQSSLNPFWEDRRQMS